MHNSPLYFEDVSAGTKFVTPRRTVTETDVVNFAGLAGDFNPLHVDRVFASQSPFGQPIAHGMLVLSIVSGLTTQVGLHEGTALALLGIDEWRFLKPVFFGDTIHAVIHILETRTSSKPDRGVLIRRISVYNQRDELVHEGLMNLMVKRRQGDGDAVLT